MYQVLIAQQIVQHCNELLVKDHKVDSERDISNALVDVNAYHSGGIVASWCMHMGTNGDTNMDALTKAI